MKKRLLRLLLIGMLCISSISTSTIAYADDMPEGQGGTVKPDTGTDKEEGNSGGASDEEKAKAWEVIVGKCGEYADNVKLMWSAIRNSDYSEIVCAGILGNALTECGGNPAATNGTHYGLFQWGDDRFTKMQAYSQTQKDTSVSVGSYSFGGVATQIAFMLCELDPSGGNGVATFQYPDEATLKEFKESKTPEAAADSFRIHFERCGEQGMKQRREYATAIYTYFAGTEIDVPEDKKDESDELAEQMVETGLWSETQFVKWKTSTNSRLEFSDIQKLTNNDIYDVENWKADLEKKNSESFLIKGGRWLTMLFGIIFEVWMLFIYLAYWFDRLNNFFEYRMLELVTFGRLTISPDEDSCTFSLTTLGRGEKRTVNHKKLIEVVIIGLAFGTLIISGTFFRILNAVVLKILEILY